MLVEWVCGGGWGVLGGCVGCWGGDSMVEKMCVNVESRTRTRRYDHQSNSVDKPFLIISHKSN